MSHLLCRQIKKPLMPAKTDKRDDDTPWFHPDSHGEKAPYLIGSVTGAAGAYWAHSEAVCITQAHTALHLPAAL